MKTVKMPDDEIKGSHSLVITCFLRNMIAFARQEIPQPKRTDRMLKFFLALADDIEQIWQDAEESLRAELGRDDFTIVSIHANYGENDPETVVYWREGERVRLRHISHRSDIDEVLKQSPGSVRF